MAFRETKTVEQWRDELDQDCDGKPGNFRILPRYLFNSRAFAALGNSGTIVVLAILNKLQYKKSGKKDRKGVKISLPILRNSGEFTLTINELVARGLSRSTATRARRLVWELGFFDVIETGTVHHPGRYRYSERWRLFPDSNYHPVDQQAPGRNIYPESGFRRIDNDESGRVSDHSSIRLFSVP